MNHVIDPTYFWDAIEEFSFDYTIHVRTSFDVDDEGYQKYSYLKKTIRGSLQSDGLTQNQHKSGNVSSKTYRFYCKSLYRIDIGDIIEDKNDFYRVERIFDEYDEFGVRAAELKMVDLSQYHDGSDFVSYLAGIKVV